MKTSLNKDNHDLIIFINKIDFITGMKVMVELVEFITDDVTHVNKFWTGFVLWPYR